MCIRDSSGSGKSTLIRCINRLEEHQKGSIIVDGTELTEDTKNIEQIRAEVGMVFQQFNLFPHLSVLDNITLAPQKVKGVNKVEAHEIAMSLLNRVGIPEQSEKFPSQLSGGQQQRVAIARALAVEPKVLLLDEPLSALDLKLRQKMRTELRAIQQRVGITFIYITHDQGEALTMSDRVGVMNDGELEQVGTCYDVYEAPCTPFVATFVGENNAFFGKVEKVESGKVKVQTGGSSFIGQAGLGLDNKNYKFKAGDEVIMFVRPEAISLKGNSKKAQNSFSAEVKTIEFEGNLKNIFLRTAEDVDIRFSVPSSSDTSGMEPSKNVSLSFSQDNAVVLPTGALALD